MSENRENKESKIVAGAKNALVWIVDKAKKIAPYALTFVLGAAAYYGYDNLKDRDLTEEFNLNGTQETTEN